MLGMSGLWLNALWESHCWCRRAILCQWDSVIFSVFLHSTEDMEGKICIFGRLLVTKCLNIPFKIGSFLGCLLCAGWVIPWVWGLFCAWMIPRSVLSGLTCSHKNKPTGLWMCKNVKKTKTLYNLQKALRTISWDPFKKMTRNWILGSKYFRPGWDK